MANEGPIQGIRPGGMEQNIAASGAAILSQVDRELIKERVGETPTSGAFISQIRSLLGKAAKLDQSTESRKSQKQTTEQDLEALDRQVKLERRLIRLAPVTPRERVEIHDQPGEASDDQLGQREGIDLGLLKRYAVAFAHNVVRNPSSKVQLDEFTLSLRQQIPAAIAEKIEQSVVRALWKQLSREIRSILLNRLERPLDFIRLLLKVRYPRRALTLMVTDEMGEGAISDDSLLKNSPLSRFDVFGRPERNLRVFELVLLSRGLGINLEAILSKWRIDKVSIQSLTTITLGEEEQKQIAQKSELLALYRNAWIAYWLERNPLRQFSSGIDLRRLKAELVKGGATRTELEGMEKQARHVAWYHAVAELKELHLRRVFSGSRTDFNRLSQHIEWLTRRARHLGRPISPEGLKWVEARLEVLAMEAAQYKLNLLQSMQKLAFDRARERDIQWLSQTTAVLKKRLPSPKEIQEAELALA